MKFKYFPSDIAAALADYLGEIDMEIIDNIDRVLYYLKAICENRYNDESYRDFYRALEKFTAKQKGETGNEY